MLDWLEHADVTPAHAGETVLGAARDRHPDTGAVRLERDRVDPAGLAALPLFASLDDEQLQRAARSARMMSARPGEEIVRKWEAARDFYVLTDGTAEAHDDGRHLRDLAPGDFFGELAALEWGAGFGYPRLASVVATSPVEAIVLSSDALNAPTRVVLEVARVVSRAVRQRLPRS